MVMFISMSAISLTQNISILGCTFLGVSFYRSTSCFVWLCRSILCTFYICGCSLIACCACFNNFRRLSHSFFIWIYQTVDYWNVFKWSHAATAPFSYKHCLSGLAPKLLPEITAGLSFQLLSHQTPYIGGGNKARSKRTSFKSMLSSFAADASKKANEPALPIDLLQMKYEYNNLENDAAKDMDVSAPASSHIETHADFPPSPIRQQQINSVIRQWCDASDPTEFEESGCSVCGQLTLKRKLSPLSHIANLLPILEATGVTRLPRTMDSDLILEEPGPVLDKKCKMVCDECRASLYNGKIPKFALCNGLWLGDVPPELQNLTFYEKLLISRVQHSICFVRVRKGGDSGHSKLVSNVIAFENPTPKIHNILPPPKKEIEEVLAILFSGNCKPTDADYQRALLFVRRNVVARALNWLILNSFDYDDVSFSAENLEEYAFNEPFASVEYFEKGTNRTAEGVSVFDHLEEDGVEEEECVFTVHGLIGEDLEHLTTSQLKARAIKHLDDGGKFLRISHAEKPESIYNNPHLYPKMFPWLFPYGLGGIGSTKLSTRTISDEKHKRFLLMYHDKRFQKDLAFPFVAFSHEQVKGGSTQAFLLADTAKFDDMSSRLLNVDKATLKNLSMRMANEEFVIPDTDSEKQCFDLLRDLDYASSKIKGSITSKKNMQHEIWSLVAHVGGPSWYFTLAPCDFKHPICIYYADTREKFDVPLQTSTQRRKLLSSNPVAGARFFDYMVQLFLEHVIGNESSPGLFGPTSAYYCTVEQQGCLTLHLHGLVFTKKKLSPLEIKERLLDPDSNFQQQLLSYVDSVRIGEFLSGDKDTVRKAVEDAEKADNYISPELTLPVPPPPECGCKKNDCLQCHAYNEWYSKYTFTIDDLLLKANLHDCMRAFYPDGTIKSLEKFEVSCLNNKYKQCKARFPRTISEISFVDPETGHITLKKLEAWLNDIIPALTYLLRCNTDVTCLFSGTAIKATIAYIANYITKVGLKTHVIFDAIKTIFDANSEIVHGPKSAKDKARQLLTKLVNLLSAKLELGSPMISLYLLQNPDHYASHIFVPFYWKSFVAEACKYWHPEDAHINTKVVLLKQKGQYIGIAASYDYIYRPSEHEHFTLYEWVTRFRREKGNLQKKNPKKKAAKRSKMKTPLESNSENDCSDNDYIESIPYKDKDSERFFLKEHPLSDACYIAKHRYPDRCVPNFIGGPLPRPDKGSREYYCSTMLTFFKPWRSGNDLKGPEESWHDAFENYSFGEKEQLYIKNLNLRYECLDSKDDYRAQLKAGKLSHIADSLPFSMIDDSTFDSQNFYTSSDDDIIDIDGENDTITLYDPVTGLKPGRRYLTMQKSMKIMRDVLLSCGWTKSFDKRTKNASFNTIQSEISYRKPEDWSKALMTMRAEIVEQRHSNQQGNDPKKKTPAKFRPNVVEICDRHFFDKFGIDYGSVKKLTQSIIQAFQLNEEQQRAFRIVTHHSSAACTEGLLLYIGGKGGTGKSQVIKALQKFFMEQKKSFAIVTCAPTGNAAALLGGSTYHFLLGINGQVEETRRATMSQVAQRLDGVEYVVLDEVSMVKCFEMYRISEQLAKARNNPAESFGNMSMIFAGDFGQLPPVPGNESVSLCTHRAGFDSTTYNGQCAAIGKGLWHQVINVVILREDMRNTGATEADLKFCQALDNMRYKACTREDIRFLNTLVSSEQHGRHYAGAQPWRDAPIIVGENKEKDEINRLGCMRFAQDTGQKLTRFYCDDTINSVSEPTNGKPRKRQSHKSKVTAVGRELQEILWDQPPSCHEHNAPPMLKLCHGMPVIIRHNVATELNITKGQRGFVHDWHTGKGKFDQPVLDVLFILLDNPPSPVSIQGLPLNVVPISRRKCSGYVTLPDDTKIYISRLQVDVLPGFAMTCHASQGQSLSDNATDLNTFDNHHAFYTALSRSRSAARTVILQGFDPRHITGGASGALRREFRELELLNEITCLRYEGELHPSVQGKTRKVLIENFIAWKGSEYVPSKVHNSIKWSKEDPYTVLNETDSTWKLIDKKDFKKSNQKNQTKQDTGIMDIDTVPPSHQQLEGKRKFDSSIEVNNAETTSRKRAKPTNDQRTSQYGVAKNYTGKKNRQLTFNMLGQTSTTTSDQAPSASSASAEAQQLINIPTFTLAWSNNSCAYDSVFPILLQIWNESRVSAHNFIHIPAIYEAFAVNHSGLRSLEDVRDDFRRSIQQRAEFHWGIFCSVTGLLKLMLELRRPCIAVEAVCANGHHSRRHPPEVKSAYLEPTFIQPPSSTNSWINNIPQAHFTQCIRCNTPILRSFKLVETPSIIAFNLEGLPHVAIDERLTISSTSLNADYTLKGIVYYGEGHFISRFIDQGGRVMLHDGMRNSGRAIMESHSLGGVDLRYCDSIYSQAAAIYRQV